MKGSVILFIDTSSNAEIIVGLEVNGKKDEIRRALDRQRAQVVLPLIDELLTTHSLKPTNISSVHVVTGPGSFTGLRVGVSIANMVGSYLQVPINDLPAGQIVTPQYS